MTTSASYSIPAQPQLPTAARRNAAPISDVLLFHTVDGGEIEVLGGQPTMSDGLATSVYLSLFGGNEDDAVIDGTLPLSWWANLDEIDEARRYRSQTQHLLRALPARPQNLLRVEDAVKADLAWMLAEVATSVACSASMPGRNRLALELEVHVRTGEKYRWAYTAPWGVT